MTEPRAPLPLPARLAHQWQAPLQQRSEVILARLFQALEARTLTFDEAIEGLAQMKAYADLLAEIARDSRQFEAERRAYLTQRGEEHG